MSDDTSADEVAGDEWAEAMQEQAEAEAVDNNADVQQAQMETLVSEDSDSESNVNLEAILDIPVSLSVRIGKTNINIRNLLQLNQGSVVELDRLAGEPLDVMVNNTLVAHGEIVVVNEKYGIRLTDVISAHERVKNLQ